LEKSRKIELIVEGCRSNRRDAQKALYDNYCDAMFSTAFRILNNRDDAHDVLQDSFIEIFKHINDFRGESTIGAWIKTIVVRKALKNLRSLKFIENYEENGTEIPLDFLDDLSGQYLEQLILSLPEGYRTVFLLVEVEGFSHSETAVMLGISEGTSKSQLSRAKKTLRKQIEKINAF
jgi:RNA polymerase sigma-70 factor (ECF subfamily)